MLRLFVFGLAFLLSWCPSSLAAQPDTTVQAIDQQVWIPFVRAYNAYDAEAFNRLHTPDVVRGTPWGIRFGTEYFQRNTERFARDKADGHQHRIALTFEYRVQHDSVAYEVGYYRVINIRNGVDRAYYGQFHAVLRKTKDGNWLIAQDWDSDLVNGTAVTEADFQKWAEKGVLE